MVELTDTAACFNFFPWPPSVNTSYTGKERRVASPALKDFKRAVMDYYLVNLLIIKKCRTHFSTLIHDRGLGLAVHRFYHYQYDQLFSKNGHLLANDVTNRIKAVDDALGDLLDIDDKHIWEGSEKKLVTKRHPHVRIIVTSTVPSF